MTNENNGKREGLAERFIDWVNGVDPGAKDIDSKKDLAKEKKSKSHKHHDDYEYYMANVDEIKETDELELGQRARKYYNLFSIIFTISIIVVLLVTVNDLPRFGDPNNPALNEVSRRYVEQGVEEAGAINTVAGMILDYRAFDTFGEAIMLFTSTIGVLTLLRKIDSKEDQ